MTSEPLTYPPIAAHREYARLPSHRGSATFRLDDTIYSGFAEFLLPADGQAICAFHTAIDQKSQAFGTDLVIDGAIDSGPFHIECAHCYVHRQPEGAIGPGGWSLIYPVNGPVRVQYGPARAVVTATVLLNNFDYGFGDGITKDGGFTNGTTLSIDTGERRVTFRHHRFRKEILPLVEAGILHEASLTEFTIDVVPGESDDQVLAFSADVADLCTFASGASVGVPMVDLLDTDGAIARRVIPQPVTSRFLRNDIVDDMHVPELFRVAFNEYVNMKQAHPAWRRLASYCGSIKDAPYLEQKFASLIMALEFFMRNCLVEPGQPKRQPEKWVEKLDFHELIGAVRNHLSWDVPNGYSAVETIRLLRNAVMHGNELPTKDMTELRLLFLQWRLFLFRRVLMRLGYTGKVVSPYKGQRSGSDVADFSEESNSFALPSNLLTL